MNKVYYSLLFSALLYGSISTVAKPSIGNINPVFLSSLIYLIMGITFFLINILSRNISITKNINIMGLIFIIAVFGSVCGPILYFVGLNMTNASFASILINTEFVFTILIAVLFLKEKLTFSGVGGIASILISLIILNIDELQSFIDIQSNNFIGNMLIILSTFFWALDNSLSKVVLDRGTPVTTLLQYKSLIGGSISLVLVIILGVSLTFEIKNAPSLIFLSLGGFAGSLFLFMKGLKEAGLIKAVMIFSTSSIFGVVFAMTILNEDFNIVTVVLSLVFMVTGIFLITRNS